LSANQQYAGTSQEAMAPGLLLGDDLDCLPIAPLLAGARARGLADAFEMLGIAAILLAADGDVLFANPQAEALFGAHLKLSGERLIAGDEADQRELRRMMEAAVSGQNRSGELIVQRAGLSALKLRATPVASPDRDPFQLLRAVIILDQMSARPGR
jgi:PAS domain-containing protein